MPGDDAATDVTEPADEPEADQPADEATAASGRGAARQARRDAKALARQRRTEAREKLAAAKAQARTDALAAKAAARVDSETAEQVSPEVLELTHEEPSEPVVETPGDEKPPTPATPSSSTSSRIDPVALAAAATPDDTEIVVEAETVEEAPAQQRRYGRGPAKDAPLDFARYELERVESGEAARDAAQKAEEEQARERAEAEAAEQAKAAAKEARRKAKEASDRERAEAKEASDRERAEAKEASDRERAEAKEASDRERAEAKAAAQQAKVAARASKKSDQTPKKDRIVEPPREPKVPIAEKVRAARPKRSTEKAPGTSARRRQLISLLAGVIGAVGLICSVVLAFGALLVALDADGGSVYDTVSSICDVLVGPLRDVFSFSGTNAAMKESLVAWGAGSIIYLVVGVVAQSMLRSALDD